ncbi:hypothetical protein TBS_10670 [Thermobispora bispora]
MGEQHCHGLETVLAQQLVEALDSALTWIYDNTLLASGGSDHVAVGLKRPCGKPGDEHGNGTCVS